MLVHIPDHFSSKYKFDFSKLPASAVDKSSSLWAIIGCLFGLLLLSLGVFELFSFLTSGESEGKSLLTVEIFAFIIILLSLGMIIGSALSLIRYKKFKFDGKVFQITYRPTFGIKHHFSEPLENYMGVRLRVLFTQSGLLSKNRYIIDLYHQDKNKIIPLFISTKNINIRKIWENYARLFKLPALSIGERGLVQREYTDLDKSITELANENKLPYISSGKLPAPTSLSLEESKKGVTIEPVGIYWDVFSTLFLLVALVATFLLIAGGVYLTTTGTSIPVIYWFMVAILLLPIIYFSTKLFNTHQLHIDQNKISVTEMYLGSSFKTDYVDIKKIENVELSYNPTIDRYSLTIITDDKVLIFGSRLPVNDLLWLKDFIIRKLTGY